MCIVPRFFRRLNVEYKRREIQSYKFAVHRSFSRKSSIVANATFGSAAFSRKSLNPLQFRFIDVDTSTSHIGRHFSVELVILVCNAGGPVLLFPAISRMLQWRSLCAANFSRQTFVLVINKRKTFANGTRTNLAPLQTLCSGSQTG